VSRTSVDRVGRSEPSQPSPAQPSPAQPSPAQPSPAPLPRRVVGAATVRRIRLIGEALFSTDAGPPPLDRLDWLTDETEDFLSRSGARARWMFTLLVLVTVVLAPVFIGRFTPLSRLERRDRIAALGALERHFGEPLLAIKAILCLIYYEHPDAARDVGASGAYAVRLEGARR
jgi:hypothetical protein